MAKIIGRETERARLDAVYQSNEAELVAVYGRRRVGKTYLIKNHFKDKGGVYLHATGVKNGAMQMQLERFADILSRVFFNGVSIQCPDNWMHAFDVLTQCIERLPKKQKVVLFFDELPWLAGRRSGIVGAIDYFWNRHWVDDPRIKLILCGSSSSWMFNKIIRNRGGLHNRVTQKMQLMPFSLQESSHFLASIGMKLSQMQVLRLYMVVGGVPYYLKQFSKDLSIDQNITQLFFRQDGLFFDEFDEVFFSLFDDAQGYRELVMRIASSPGGVPRSVIAKTNKQTGKGGHLTERLRALETSGFISSHYVEGKRDLYYRMTDPYCYFYLTWIMDAKPRLKDEKGADYWLGIINSPAYHVWAGYAFEMVCYKHIGQIKQALALPPGSLGFPWRISGTKDRKGAQIDLVFSRMDHAVTLCEIKYGQQPFVIDKEYAEVLQNKRDAYLLQTGTEDQIFTAVISASGVKPNQYSKQILSGVVKLADLFKEIEVL